MDSYGYVETLGLVTAIEAADAALKAANVTLTNCYYVKGGIVTIEVTGDVAAVNAAVDAATESAKRLGNFLSNNVIARVDSETKKILTSKINKNSEKETAEISEIKSETKETKQAVEAKKAEKKEDISEKNIKNTDVQEKIEKVSEKETEKKEDNEIKKKKKQYQDMKVVDLKMKVNNLKLGYTWNQIKTMPKKKLIEILIKNNQEE